MIIRRSGDADGIRTGKTIEDYDFPEYITYTLDGTTILGEHHVKYDYGYIDDEYDIFYYYDENGSPIGLNWNNTDYYYYKNILGDILGIMTANGTMVVRYAYDAWGNIISTTGTMANTLGKDNPFRYRGYYYDTETGSYYLNSRYYDPNVGRFLNADGLFDTSSAIGMNLFAYCGNDPVNQMDPSGEIAITTLILIGSIVAGCLAAGHTAATSYKYTGRVDVENTIIAGLGTFCTVYTWGMSAYVVYLTFCDCIGYTPVTEIGSSSNASSVPTSQPHGNSIQSTKPQHGYEIYNKETGDVVKTGISGQPLNQNGTSPRANIQVNAFNKLEGDDIYAARIVKQNIPGRAAALEWERNNTQVLWDLGNSLSKHQRPNPIGR